MIFTCRSSFFKVKPLNDLGNRFLMAVTKKQAIFWAGSKELDKIEIATMKLA
jgi:hypothetical protein